jgi:hypothetical protein
MTVQELLDKWGAILDPPQDKNKNRLRGNRVNLRTAHIIESQETFFEKPVDNDESL